ncbi:hypothetical protein PENTCL1PPCAC_23908 [Pristionchus entomophagus]|uniref:Uncharacterized protein n=1 Tax=Pristionchus entomophagus TaxID=358040 RepID=A0AAV5U6K2_9BILA|nr:hypothetical protein PENTCL1PPCAC_23908 [Pristionchus entomophagus]
MSQPPYNSSWNSVDEHESQQDDQRASMEVMDSFQAVIALKNKQIELLEQENQHLRMMNGRINTIQTTLDWVTMSFSYHPRLRATPLVRPLPTC